MDEATWLACAYEQIGRTMIAWGRLDQTIVAHTWKHNQPKSPFPSGPVERAFYKRWCKWCSFCEPFCHPKKRAAFHAFRERVAALSDFRDNLAHNVVDVFSYSDGFLIQARRAPPENWRERLNRWLGERTKRNPPPPPSGNFTNFSYGPDDLRTLLAEITAATESIRVIWANVGRGEQFEPPPTPPALTIPSGRSQASR